MRPLIVPIFSLFIWFGSNPAVAAEVERLDTGYAAGVYALAMNVVVRAPREAVVSVLTDYENLPVINPSIVVSEVLVADDPGVVRVRTVIRRCVMFYCPKLARVEDLRLAADGVLEAELLPESSDFLSGSARWVFEDLDEATRIVYRASFEPDFWVPPLIGPAVIKGALREEAQILFENAERRAREAAGLPAEISE